MTAVEPREPVPFISSFRADIPAHEVNPVIEHNLGTECIASVQVYNPQHNACMCGWQVLSPSKIRLDMVAMDVPGYSVVIAG